MALAFAGDFADAAPESDDGSGRAEDGASMVPEHERYDKMKRLLQQQSAAREGVSPLDAVVRFRLAGFTSISRIPPSKRTRTRPEDGESELVAGRHHATFCD